MFQKFTQGYNRLTNAELVGVAEVVIAGLTDNEWFSAINPSLSVLTEHTAQFKTAVSEAAIGGGQARARRDQQREQLITTLRLMTASAEGLALGDAEKKASTGIPFHKKPAAKPPLVKPDPPRLRGTGNSGEIDSRARRQPGMVGGVHQVTEHPVTPASVWHSNPSSSVKHVFKNLVPGRQYAVRFCIVGPNQQCIESDHVGYIVQ